MLRLRPGVSCRGHPRILVTASYFSGEATLRACASSPGVIHLSGGSVLVEEVPEDFVDLDFWGWHVFTADDGDVSDVGVVPAIDVPVGDEEGGFGDLGTEAHSL